MARHEFGVMHTAPCKGKRYDTYEPQKYNCISVDDIFLENIDADLNNIDFYWHTTDVKGKGLAYCGITLIPPCSVNAFIDVINETHGLSELYELAKTALNENKWIIHFGI